MLRIEGVKRAEELNFTIPNFKQLGHFWLPAVAA